METCVSVFSFPLQIPSPHSCSPLALEPLQQRTQILGMNELWTITYVACMIIGKHQHTHTHTCNACCSIINKDSGIYMYNSQGLATTHLLAVEGGAMAGAMGTKLVEEELTAPNDGWRLIRFEPPFVG